MATIEKLREGKEKHGYTYKEIAYLSGIPLGTVQKVLTGVTKSPRRKTMKELEYVLCNDNATYIYPKHLRDDNYVIYESKTAYKKKKYTLDDYYTLSKQRRMELINGELIEMEAPSAVHQIICISLVIELKQYIKSQDGSCMTFAAPFDVRLFCDDENLFEPDVLVVCDRDKITSQRLEGAPDFVIEILSPSSRKRDSIEKLAAYKEAGVREYWLVDPMQKRILVYVFSEEIYPVIYGFDQKVPVAIFDGKCEIDFPEISKEIQFLDERQEADNR